MLAPSPPSSSFFNFSWLSGIGLEDSPPTFVSTAIHCMDLDRLGHGPPRRRAMNSNPETPYLHTIQSPTRERQNRHSSPLPRAEWVDLPSPDRQQHQPVAGRQQRAVVRRTTSTHEYTAWNPVQYQSNQDSPDSRETSRVSPSRRLQSLEDNHLTIKPLVIRKPLPRTETSSFRNRLSINSAPDEMENRQSRLITQHNGPEYTFRSSPDDVSPTSPIRSPTYPPLVRRRASNSMTIDEAALADAEEFHLFVQATAGLELEDAFVFNRADRSSSPHPLQERQHIPSRAPTRHMTTSPHSASPLDESSMTMRAMRHLAQMPEGSQSYLSNLGSRPQPLAGREMILEISQMDDLDDFEDELPGYEESQAQAQADQRTEAARRAQELYVRWQLTGARRPA